MAKKSVIDDLRKRIEILESSETDFARKRCSGDAQKQACEPLQSSSPSPSDEGEGRDDPEPDNGAVQAFKKIVSLVNHADRSEKTIRERLSRDGYNDSDIDIAVQRAIDCGFIDDMRFAEVLVRSRISQLKGAAGIVRELSGNGIEATDIPGWPYEFGASREEEIDRALSFLHKKPPHTKNLRDGAFRKLVQRGFASDVASSAARMYTDDTRG